MSGRRVVEIIIGLGLVGLCLHALKTGTWRGSWRRYIRSEDPGAFWTGLLITLAIGLAFLFGETSWRP